MTRQQRMATLLQDLLAVCQKHDCEIDRGEWGGAAEIRFADGCIMNDFYICPTHAVIWIGLNRYYVGKQYALPLLAEE